MYETYSHMLIVKIQQLLQVHKILVSCLTLYVCTSMYCTVCTYTVDHTTRASDLSLVSKQKNKNEK